MVLPAINSNIAAQSTLWNMWVSSSSQNIIDWHDHHVITFELQHMLPMCLITFWQHQSAQLLPYPLKSDIISLIYARLGCSNKDNPKFPVSQNRKGSSLLMLHNYQNQEEHKAGASSHFRYSRTQDDSSSTGLYARGKETFMLSSQPQVGQEHNSSMCPEWEKAGTMKSLNDTSIIHSHL